MQQQHLALSVIAPEKTDLLKQIAEICAQYQCQITEARFSANGQNHIIMMYIAGSWNAIAKVESPLLALASQENVFLKLTRTEMQAAQPTLLPYIVHITSVSAPQTLDQLLAFFTSNQIKLNDLAVTQYLANRTQAKMQTIVMTVLIPVETHLADLRESFIIFCDEYNLDAIFEPDRL
ncbi:MAG: ACT domain-containing protein [Gammaproteobacteria bacterium]|nr:ACT domain-containing protein [Gammaproteobacteria bacterium]